jgi:hypothetical protein
MVSKLFGTVMGDMTAANEYLEAFYSLRHCNSNGKK